MPALREVLATAFSDVRTYVQSGNVVLVSGLPPEQVARDCEHLIEERFGFPVDVLVRTRDDLAEVVRRDPLGAVALDPKRYQVTFLETELDDAARAKLKELEAPGEPFLLAGRELYSWHPAGVGRSKLWARLASDRRLGVTATARNWTTVTTLLKMADGEA
jgi:uncharacterized protein (DUF1697 family)